MKRILIRKGMTAVASAVAAIFILSAVLLSIVGQTLLVWIPAALAAVVIALSYFYFVSAANEIERSMTDPAQLAVSVLKDIAASEYEPLQFPAEKKNSPQITEMNALALSISGRIKKLKADRARITDMLDNMSEGLVVLESDLTITLINKSALNFFDVSENIKGQNMLRMIHMPKMVEAAEQAAHNGQHAVFDIKSGDADRVLQILISPIGGIGKSAGGAIMLITDVTAVRRAEQIRSDFVANVSHEMKTPLTSIKGFTELMESGMVDNPEQSARYLELIRKETERMIELIGDILKLSELESVVSDTGKAQVSLKLIAQRVVESLAMQMHEKYVNVMVTGDTGMLSANPDRMTEVVLNLVDNAIKYNKPGGQVEVNIEKTEDAVILTVSDSGVGIPAEAQERVFERFYRVDKSRSRKQGGTGLGLSIVKHIAELYKGTITLDSKPGEGTTIQITLPVN